MFRLGFRVIPGKTNLEKYCAIQLGPCGTSRYISEFTEACVTVHLNHRIIDDIMENSIIGR